MGNSKNNSMHKLFHHIFVIAFPVICLFGCANINSKYADQREDLTTVKDNLKGASEDGKTIDQLRKQQEEKLAKAAKANEHATNIHKEIGQEFNDQKAKTDKAKADLADEKDHWFGAKSRNLIEWILGSVIILFVLRIVGSLGEGPVFTVITAISRVGINILTLGAEWIYRTCDKWFHARTADAATTTTTDNV